MSDPTQNPLALLQQQGNMVIPAALRGAMEQMQNSEMQTGVGASFAVVTIKGKTFGIKHGGQTQHITMEMNGQTYASPFFDVVIPKAKAELSKTWYPTGYQDGSDEAPKCWSEDGINPLAPLVDRPLDEVTNQPCVDCRSCPMNRFGSKVSETGAKGKACADTRKLVVTPVAADGQVDFQNIRYGGGMLLRVPAASLRPFAEYDAKLQQMGLCYFGVVTRLEFDPTQAYPKFVLKALRVLTDAEIAEVLAARDSVQTRQILAYDQHATAAVAPQLAGPAPAAAVAPPVPLAQTPVVPSAPQNSVAPQPPTSPTSNVVPLQASQAPAAPLQPPAPPPQAPPAAPPPAVVPMPLPVPQQAPPQAPPQLPPQAPPAAPPQAPPPPPPVQQPSAAVHSMTAKATASYDAYKANGWTDDQMIAEGVMMGSVGAPPPPAAAPAPVPGQGPQVTAALMNTVDSLLAG